MYGIQSQADGGSLFSGGGFMPSQATQVNESGFPSVRKSGNSTGLLPLTVKQISQATQKLSDENSNFIIDGVDVNNVTLVGMVSNKEERVTDVSFHLDDGTGRMEVKRWSHVRNLLGLGVNDSMESAEMANVQNGSYVRVHGHLRSFQGKKHVNAFSVRCKLALSRLLKDHNQQIVEAVDRRIYSVKGTLLPVPHCSGCTILKGIKPFFLKKWKCTDRSFIYIGPEQFELISEPSAIGLSQCLSFGEQVTLSSMLWPQLKPVTDFNEVTFHFLECIFVHLYNIKVQGGSATQLNPVSPAVQGGSMGPPTGMSHATAHNQFMSPGGVSVGGSKDDCNRRVQSIFEEPANLAIEQGVHVDEVARRLPGFTKKQIMEAIVFLSNEGYIYSTIDEEHFKYWLIAQDWLSALPNRGKSLRHSSRNTSSAAWDETEDTNVFIVTSSMNPMFPALCFWLSRKRIEYKEDTG
eukprot:Gb_15876 [translate_table: standard]